MGKRTILIVEDSQTARKQLSDILSKNGYNIVSAENGKEALEHYSKGFFPVILTDLKMPVMDGNELISELKQMNPPPLILVLTVDSKTETVISIMKKGAFDYINKPVKTNDLLMKIDRAFLACERNRINRVRENEKTVAAIFGNLQRSFNQGAGLGIQMTLIQVVIENLKEKGDKCIIDKAIIDELKKKSEYCGKNIKEFV